MLMIFALPPPFTGQSIVNEHLLTLLHQELLNIKHVDISPGVKQGISYHVSRVKRVFNACVELLRTDSRAVYFSSEAGFGVIYLIVLVTLARLRQRRIFFHHHVISYISERSFFHEILIWLAGKYSFQITLSPTMSERFGRHFGLQYPRLTLRNAIFVDDALRRGFPERALRADGTLMLGFIGRLEEAKGFDDYLGIVQLLQDDPRVRFVIAGDASQAFDAAGLEALRARLGPRLDLRGFVSGAEKVRFFQDVDILAFPSKYRNEASPMVCYEALAMGVPVLTTEVGAVTDIVDDSCGEVLAPGANVVAGMTEALRRHVALPALLVERQRGARTRFREFEATAEAELRMLCEVMRAADDA